MRSRSAFGAIVLKADRFACTAKGETKYIRTSTSFGVAVGRINFELVNAPEAESELESLSYTGAPK
jgi:hypothetical protein